MKFISKKGNKTNFNKIGRELETITQKMNDNGSEIYKALFRGPDLLIRSGHSGCNKAEL